MIILGFEKYDRKSIDRLAEDFQENKERYQREFNKILEYKDKVGEEEKQR